MSLSFPNIDPVALSLGTLHTPWLDIGPIEIKWYALAYLAGFLLGWKYALYIAGLDKDKEPRGKFISAEAIDDFFPWAILGVIIGGRIGYILFYQLEMYLSDPAEMFKVWHGGMSFHGGALGVCAAMVSYAFAKKLPLLRLTDIVCCAVPIGLFFGRIANFVNGELYGRTTDAEWGIVFPYGGDLPRHPSQLYEAALEGALLFLIMLFVVRNEKLRNSPGLLSGIFLAGYGAFRAFIELFREPDSQLGFIFAHITMGQILCVPMVLGGLFLIFYSRTKNTAAAV